MDIKRLLLTVGLAVVGVMLWTQWQQEHPSTTNINQGVVSSSNATNSSASGFVPAPVTSSGASSPVSVNQHSQLHTNQANNADHRIQVKTDTLNLSIDLHGANIVGATLPHYPVSLQKKNTPISILSTSPGQYYVLQSGVTSTGQSTKPLLYKTSQRRYQLAAGENSLAVTLKARQGDLLITKTYQLQRGAYQVHLVTTVKNSSIKPWSGIFYHQIARQKPEHHFGSMAYNAGAITSKTTPYKKIKYANMDKANLSEAVKGGWVVMQQHYFLSAWLPQANQQHHYYSQVRVDGAVGSKIYYLGLTSNLVQLKPGQVIQNASRFYVGPEKISVLAKMAPGLKLTVDYGILSPVSLLIFWVMQQIHQFIGNWGWTIILVTVFIKGLLYWPSALSYRSMARMKVLAPRLKILQERHANDKQALSKATMELYKTEKVNPMGGCLPMVVQIPIFIALYWVLIESVQLRQAPFIFWIHDLSVKDPFYVLPILMGVSMFLQQKMAPAPADPSMAKMQMIMPVVFTVFFMHFPAGLVLYWLTNNLVSVAQQSYVMKTYNPKKADQQQRYKKKRKR